MLNKRHWNIDWVDIVSWCIVSTGIALMIFTVVALFHHATGIKEGTIYDKDYDPAYTTYIHSGKVMVPQYHSESWQLYFKDENGNKNWVDVDETTYSQYDVGDYWDGE